MSVHRFKSRRTGSYNHVYTSGSRGVYSRSGKWNAQIQYNGKKLVSLVCGDEIVLGELFL